ncbi:MAG: flagellar basal body P-ring protein FlgI [Proteobacteria bacterium]|nr:flagellar basal body P-ring protein FlgI [Pseudomonadota bacterium]
MKRNSTLFTPKARQTKLRRLVLGALAALLVLAAAGAADAMSRIKDIADFEGVRENQLVGYGLVVGLNGTGDSLNNSPFTRQSLIGMLERLGVNTRGLNLKTANIAAVMVTATLPSFARQGRRIDVTISALGDATNLLGGTLLVTPLMGADSEVYAVAQGQLAVGGFAASGASGSSVSQGVPTSARIPNGAIIERESEFDLASLPNLNIALRNPDFTTATRIARAINARIGEPAAEATDPGTVHLQVPDRYQNKVAKLLTEIEQLLVEPDQPARVVIDERSGIIVMGENVRISTVAIAQGKLTVRITETPQVSQPGPFAPQGAATVVVPRTEIEIDEATERRMAVLSPGVSLHELVEGLNALGVGPRDIIMILQAIKSAGALQAEIKVL